MITDLQSAAAAIALKDKQLMAALGAEERAWAKVAELEDMIYALCEKMQKGSVIASTDETYKPMLKIWKGRT